MPYQAISSPEGQALAFHLTSGSLYLVFGVLAVIYIYLWLYRPAIALRITAAIGRVLFAVGKLMVKAFVAIVEFLWRLISRRRR